MSSSPISTDPAVGSSSPATILSVVVLPQPDGPSRAKNDPAGGGGSGSSPAVIAPKRLVSRASRRSPSSPSCRGADSAGAESGTRHRRELIGVVLLLCRVEALEDVG